MSTETPPKPAAAPSAPRATRPRRVYVIGFDAERGAETFFLLRVLRWLRAAGVEVELLLWRHGPLLGELREVCRVRVVDDLTRSWIDRLLRMVRLDALGVKVKGLRLRIWMWQASRRFPHTLVRGIRSARALKYTPRPLPAVVHLSEEERPWRDQVSEAEWRTILATAGGFIVPDADARDLLVADGVAEAKVAIQEGFVPDVTLSRIAEPTEPTEPTGASPRDLTKIGAGRRALGVPESAILICGTGTEDWWRSPEPFVAFAWGVAQRFADAEIHFLWLCHDIDDEDALWPLRHDIANAGMTDRFHLATVTVLLEQFELCDLVVLTGRPDTFSVISGELRLSARPVVCFANGATERELGDAAVAVPYLDVEAAVDAVEHLLEDPDAARELTERAASRAGRAQELSTDLPQWLLEITGELLA